jgi:hypothetical protein
VLVLAACGDGGNSKPDGNTVPPPVCGDGIANGSELCDGSDLAGHTNCLDIGYYDSGPLACTATCQLDAAQCGGTCGDGIVQPDHEYCDGADPASTCTDFGFGAGAVTCARCGPDFVGCSYFGWYTDYLSFAPTSISGTSDANVWITGPDGTAHWDGATWQPFTPPDACGLTGAGFSAVAAVGPGDVWLGRDSVVVHVTPTGCDKYTLDDASSVLVSSIVPLAPDDVWLVGFDKVWHFDGQTWTPHTVMLEAIWAAGHDDIYGVDATNTIHHFDGSNWTATTLGAQRAFHTLWGTGPNDIYVGGRSPAASIYEQAVVEHYDGSTWSELTLTLPNSPNDWVTSISGTDQHMFGGLLNTNAIRIHEGTGWTALSTPDLRVPPLVYPSPTGRVFVVPRTFPQVFRFDGTDERYIASIGRPNSFALVSPSEMYAVTGTASVTRLSSFDGESWHQDSSLTSVNSVTTALSGDVLALASDGLHTRTSSGWSAAAPGLTSGPLMWAASPTDIWATNSTGRLHHFDGTTDSGCATCTFTARQVWGTSSTDLYAVDVSTFKHWDGSAWTDAPAPATFHPYELVGWAPNDIAALDDDGAVWHFDGTTWTTVGFPYAVTHPRHIWGTSMHDLFVANGDTDIFHYDGTRWSPVNLLGAFHILGIAGVGDTVVFFDIPEHHLVRTRPWP